MKTKNQPSINQSGLEPSGVAVLVEAYEPERAKSLIAMPATVAERTKLAETRAVVIAVGPEAWKDELNPRAMPGDKVLITRFAGHAMEGPLDGKWYRIINDRDIFCRITADRFGQVQGLDGEPE